MLLIFKEVYDTHINEVFVVMLISNLRVCVERKVYPLSGHKHAVIL